MIKFIKKDQSNIILLLTFFIRCVYNFYFNLRIDVPNNRISPS